MARSGSNLSFVIALKARRLFDDTQINTFQLLDLLGVIEFAGNDFSALFTDRGAQTIVTGEFLQGTEQCLRIRLIDQKATDAVANRLGNSTVPRRDRRQTGGHRFQQAIRHTFPVPFASDFTRMHEYVAGKKKLSQRRSIKEPGKDHVWHYPQLTTLRLELVPKRPISGNGQRCSGKPLLKPREGSERHSETFLFDQPTRLYEAPSISRRLWSMVERVKFERNSSPLHLHFIGRTASFLQ